MHMKKYPARENTNKNRKCLGHLTWCPDVVTISLDKCCATGDGESMWGPMFTLLPMACFLYSNWYGQKCLHLSQRGIITLCIPIMLYYLACTLKLTLYELCQETLNEQSVGNSQNIFGRSILLFMAHVIFWQISPTTFH